MIDNNSVFFYNISNKGINYAGQLFKENRNIKERKEIKTELNLENIIGCTLLMLYLVLGKKYSNRKRSHFVYNNHLIKSSQVYALNKLNSNYYIQSK